VAIFTTITFRKPIFKFTKICLTEQILATFAQACVIHQGVTQLTLSVGKAVARKFCFFREAFLSFFSARKGLAYLKTLDVRLLIRFLNVLD